MAFIHLGQRLKSLRRTYVRWVLSVIILLSFFYLLYIGYSIRIKTQTQTQIQIQSQSQTQTHEFRQKSPDSSNSAAESGNSSYPKPRYAIRGFTYDGVEKGQKRIRITADSFVIQKKKLGFLRFGLLEEAVFTNAKIDLYGIDLVHNGKPDQDKSDHEKGGNSMENQLFAGIFSSDKILFVPEKVSSVRMAPVEIYLHDDQNRVVGFSAEKGEIRLRDKKILMSGRAKAQCEQRQINAARISLVPERSFVVAEHGVIYRLDSVQWKGDQLITDFFLNRTEVTQKGGF